MSVSCADFSGLAQSGTSQITSAASPVPNDNPEIVCKWCVISFGGIRTLHALFFLAFPPNWHHSAPDATFLLIFLFCHRSNDFAEIKFDYYDKFLSRWQHMNGVLIAHISPRLACCSLTPHMLCISSHFTYISLQTNPVWMGLQCVKSLLHGVDAFFPPEGVNINTSPAGNPSKDWMNLLWVCCEFRCWGWRCQSNHGFSCKKKNVFLTMQRAGGEQRVCVGVFVWGVLELCVAEARSEAVSAFMRRLIEKEKPLFSMSVRSCSLLLSGDPTA